MTGGERAGDASPAALFERFTTPPRCAASARELAVLERGEPLCVELRGAPLFARVWGAGPTVLLVHGWGGRAAQLASFVDPLVARGLRAVAADALAHGASPGERSNVLELVELVGLLADSFGPVRGAVGHSLGGAALLMAAERGLDLGRLALVAPTASLSDELDAFLRAAGAFSSREAVRAHARELLGADLWERTTLANLAPRVRAATLVVHDEHDPDTPFAAGAALAAAMPNATLHPTRGLGHSAPLRTRAVVEAAVEHVAPERARP